MTMNLHAIAAPFVAIVTGAITATWRQSAGYTYDPSGNGSRIAAYNDTSVDVRVQSLESDELTLLDSLTIQGIKRKIYLTGNVEGVDRAGKGGGDLIVFGTDAGTPLTLRGTTWLARLVLETWDASGWCCVAVTKQIDGAT